MSQTVTPKGSPDKQSNSKEQEFQSPVSPSGIGVGLGEDSDLQFDLMFTRERSSLNKDSKKPKTIKIANLLIEQGRQISRQYVPFSKVCSGELKHSDLHDENNKKI